MRNVEGARLPFRRHGCYDVLRDFPILDRRPHCGCGVCVFGMRKHRFSDCHLLSHADLIQLPIFGHGRLGGYPSVETPTKGGRRDGWSARRAVSDTNNILRLVLVVDSILQSLITKRRLRVAHLLSTSGDRDEAPRVCPSAPSSLGERSRGP